MKRADESLDTLLGDNWENVMGKTKDQFHRYCGWDVKELEQHSLENQDQIQLLFKKSLLPESGRFICLSRQCRANCFCTQVFTRAREVDL